MTAIELFVVEHEFLVALLTLGGVATGGALYEAYNRKSKKYGRVFATIIIAISLLIASYSARQPICELAGIGCPFTISPADRAQLQAQIKALKPSKIPVPSPIAQVQPAQPVRLPSPVAQLQPAQPVRPAPEPTDPLVLKQKLKECWVSNDCGER